MPNIIDPAAITFCNQEVRPYADAEAQAYWTAKKLLNNWNSLAMSAKIPNDASLIVDGSATDGRNAVTGAQITNVITRAQEKIADYEAATNGKLTTITQVAVQTQPRF